ncbi:hypothetical protein AVEN_13594-1 [Araneus ventricosus]|uniref:Uncharacterized protein n=1 Tax=Araneus ventricosus TaxID=182803 RepID=A0A4Y2D3N4_ARAVE|nr:hypothetical protein AVEN_13594-1 [Araneus ventricosus]
MGIPHCEVGRGGLVARPRPRDWRVPGSISDFAEDPPCMASYVVAKRLRTGAVRKFGEGRQLRRRHRHLTSVQNHEVRPKIALALLQNGTLI